MANLRTAIIGLFAGLFGGLLGLGGGVVMVPLLTGWARLSQHRAHATSLVAVVFTGLLGGWAYAMGGAVDWGVAVLVAAAATVTSAISASRAANVSAARLRQWFGIMLIAVAFLLPFGEQLTGPGIIDVLRVPAALLVGGFAGLLTGLLGVGGGSVVVPLLILVFGFDQHLAQGTSLAVMVPAGIAGTLVHWRQRSIAGSIVPGLIAGIAVGAFFGGRLALGIPELPLQLVFIALLIWTGVRYLRRGRKAAATPTNA